MSPAKWLGVAFVLFLASGVALIVVPAASVSGLRLTTGAPVKVAGSLVTVPVQISNQGFLGIAVSGLQVKVVDGGVVLLSHGIGSVDIPPGGKVAFQVPFLNVTSPATVIGNLSGEVTGEAEVGGIVPVGLTVAASVVTAAASPAAGGALAASLPAALIAAGAVERKGGDGSGEDAHRGRTLRWCGGVGLAATYVVVLVVAPRLAEGAVSGVVSRAAGAGAGLVMTSGFAGFVMGAPYAVLLVAVAAVEALLKGSELGVSWKGRLKVAEGALLGLTFYLLLGGGTTPVDLYFRTVAADFSVGVLLPLALLEIAAGSRVVEGVVEAGFSGPGRKGEDGARQKQVDAAVRHPR
ncbi:MAG: hypothetical protein JRN21_05320 [Nitrososphaerota archaeon]|nr:hypothetical protein [Nitrososphaerota archaeon]